MNRIIYGLCTTDDPKYMYIGETTHLDLPRFLKLIMYKLKRTGPNTPRDQWLLQNKDKLVITPLKVIEDELASLIKQYNPELNK